VSGELLSALFSLIAIGVAIWALAYQRSSAKSAKRSADEAALAREASERSATAAEESAVASARSAEAAERSALSSEEMLEIERARDLRPTIAWSLERPSKQRLRLRNTGTETATGVRIRDIVELRQKFTFRDAPDGSDIPAGMFQDIGFTESFNVSPTVLWIMCNEQAEPVPVEIPPWSK
jgi:hypothetical protein